MDKLQVLLKTSKLRLSKCIDDVFTVPDTEAKLARKSVLELVDASIALSYKVVFAYFAFELDCNFRILTFFLIFNT